MRYIKSEDLTSGMMTVKNIYNEDGIKILARNSVLSDRLIDRVRKLGYDGLYILDGFDDDIEDTGFLSDEERIAIIKSLKTLDLDKVLYYSNFLVERLLSQDSLLLDFKELMDSSMGLYQHSINVALYATATGIGMGFNNEQLGHLAFAALVHDIGKNNIPNAILDKDGPLDEEERALINKHPVFGYEILKKHNDVPLQVQIAVLEHHENFDGTGYPEGRKGDDIFMLARVLHAADVYDALRSKRSYKTDFGATEAIEYMMGNCDTMFDTDVITVFLKYLVVYPAGTDVILSNNEVVRVVENHVENVLRPVIRTQSGNEVDLYNDKRFLNITIVGSKTNSGGTNEIF